jgi:hypothetical protein
MCLRFHRRTGTYGTYSTGNFHSRASAPSPDFHRIRASIVSGKKTVRCASVPVPRSCNSPADVSRTQGGSYIDSL